MFGVICLTSGAYRIVRVETRDVATLHVVMQETVELGSVRFSDSFSSHSDLHLKGYEHHMINLSKHKHARTGRRVGVMKHVGVHLRAN